MPADDARLSRMHLLDERELRVLSLAADGLSNREIAKMLNLSPETVKDNMASLLGKLGVRNRAQAAGVYGRWLERQRRA